MIKPALDPGTYVVAVSGGVDSMVLLDVLHKQHGLTLIVAHYDHGIRKDSAKDKQLVEKTALKYGLPFVFDEGFLGSQASEAIARKARYDFLHKVRIAAKAKAIITAHHKDDMLETAIINMLRGTGRRGLSSLGSRDTILRPFLDADKADIKRYATTHDVKWREDSTNQDETYLRNYVRKNILTKFSAAEQKKLWQLIDDSRSLNQTIDDLLSKELGIRVQNHQLDRQWFIGLSHDVAKEVMMSWLRSEGVQTFDKKTIERLVMAAKTYEPHKQANVIGNVMMVVRRESLVLKK